MPDSSFDVLTIPAPSEGENKVVLYLHGDSAQPGCVAQHACFLSFIAAQVGCSVVAPGYSVAALFTQPEVFAAVESIYQSCTAQVEARNLVLLGHGAGASLALALAQHLQQSGDDLPGQLILLAPWLDIDLPMPAGPSAPTTCYCVGSDGKLLRTTGPELVDKHIKHIKLLNPSKANLGSLAPTSVFADILSPAEVFDFEHWMRSQETPIQLFRPTSPPAAWLRLEAAEADPMRRQLVRELTRKPNSFRASR